MGCVSALFSGVATPGVPTTAAGGLVEAKKDVAPETAPSDVASVVEGNNQDAVGVEESADRHIMTIYTEAKINRKMDPSWL